MNVKKQTTEDISRISGNWDIWIWILGHWEPGKIFPHLLISWSPNPDFLISRYPFFLHVLIFNT